MNLFKKKNVEKKKDTCISKIMAALGTPAKTQKQPKCMKTDEWIQKTGYIYTTQYNSEIKDETMTFPVTGKKTGDHTK